MDHARQVSLFEEGLWPCDPLIGADHRQLLARVLHDEGIDVEQVLEGDAAVIACLETATEAHAFASHAATLAAKYGFEGTFEGGAGGQPTQPQLPLPGATDPTTTSTATAAIQALETLAEKAALVKEDDATDPALMSTVKEEEEEAMYGKQHVAAKRKRKGAVATVGPPGGTASALIAVLAESAAVGEGPGLSKGLKHFSLKVAEKVEELGCTNYNRVADDLVTEMAADAQAGLLEGAFDEKNVRRRVYDALNVLEALGMLEKGKKDVRWRGWPNALGQSPAERLKAEVAKLAARVYHKKEAVTATASKALCLANLALRNREAPLPVLLAAQEQGLSAPNPLSLPFMLVHAPADAEIDVTISPDQRVAELDFQRWPFQIFDDERIMRLMGLCEPRIAPQLQFHDTATDATIGRSAHTNERPDVHDNRHQRQEEVVEVVEEERENDEDQHQQHQHPVAQQPPLGAHLSEKAALRHRASVCAGLVTTPAKHPRGDSKAAIGSQDEQQQQTVKVSPSAGVDAMGLTSRKDEERSKEANGLRY